MELDRVDRDPKFSRQLGIAAASFQRGKQVAFAVGKAIEGIGSRPVNIVERKDHIPSGDGGENFQEALGRGELIDKAGPPEMQGHGRRRGVPGPAINNNLRRSRSFRDHLQNIRGAERG